MGEVNLVPFNLYVAGSYFGDVDVLVPAIKERDGTAMAEVSTNLLVLNRKDLKYIQEKFESVSEELL